MTVVVFEPSALRASPALRVHVAASVSVALMHRPPDRGRNVPRGWGGIGLREPLPGSLRPGESLGFEPFELLGDGLLDDRGQIAVGHLWPHERPEALQLVLELGAGGELNLVPRRGEGLDDRGRHLGGNIGLRAGAGEATPSGKSWAPDFGSGSRLATSSAPDDCPDPTGGDSVRTDGRAVGGGAFLAGEASASRPERRAGVQSRRSAPAPDAWTCAWPASGARPGSPG